MEKQEEEEEEEEVGECFRLFLNILQFSPSSLAYVQYGISAWPSFQAALGALAIINIEENSGKWESVQAK